MKKWRSGLRNGAWLAAASPENDGFRRFQVVSIPNLTKREPGNSLKPIKHVPWSRGYETA
eukprot:4928625-Prymnesium_polylepis.1